MLVIYSAYFLLFSYYSIFITHSIILALLFFIFNLVYDCLSIISIFLQVDLFFILIASLWINLALVLIKVVKYQGVLGLGLAKYGYLLAIAFSRCVTVVSLYILVFIIVVILMHRYRRYFMYYLLN